MVENKYCEKLCTGKLRSAKIEAFAWRLREQLAKRWSSLIWGGGYTFESENKEIEKCFSKFAKMNQFDSQLSFIERYLSLYGRAIVILNKTKTGEVVMNIANPNYFNGVGRVVITPQVAVVWQNYQMGNQNFIIKTKMTINETINEVYGGSEDKIQISDQESEILEELQLEKKVVHNFGFIPIVEMFNIPFHPFWSNQWDFVKLTDWYCGYSYEFSLYKLLENLVIEAKYNHSRAYIENASQSLINQIKQAKLNDEDGIDLADTFIETENGAKVNIQTGQGDFTKYTSAYNDLMDLYWKSSGMSRFSEGGGAQKTVAETASVRSQMIESVNQRIAFRTNQINELICKVLAIYGLIDYWEENKNNFSFNINGNVLQDETSFIDNQIKLFQQNCSSPIQLIQKLYKCNQSEAQATFDKFKDFNEANNINLGLGDLMMDDKEQDGNFNKETGEHKQADKEGTA